MSEILIYCLSCHRFNDLDEIKNGKCHLCSKTITEPYHIKLTGSLRKEEEEFFKNELEIAEKIAVKISLPVEGRAADRENLKKNVSTNERVVKVDENKIPKNISDIPERQEPSD